MDRAGQMTPLGESSQWARSWILDEHDDHVVHARRQMRKVTGELREWPMGCRGRLVIGFVLSIILAACRTEGVYSFPRMPEPEVAASAQGPLRKYITAIEYTKYHGSRLLFRGQDTDNPPDATYEIDSSSDLVIAFPPEIRNIGGSVSVRARLMRNPIVELPVQNFTVVTEKDLKKESVLLLPAESSLFRDDKYHKEIQIQLAVAQSSSSQFGGYIGRQLVDLVRQFDEASSEPSFDREFRAAAPDRATQQDHLPTTQH